MQMCFFMDAYGIKMSHVIPRTMFNARLFSITLYTTVILPVMKYIGVHHSVILVAPLCGQ